MGKVSWLHISDLHIFPPTSKGVIAHSDQALVLKRFLNFVDKRLPSEIRKPDLIFVTGDLAFAGKHSEYFGPPPSVSNTPCVNDFLTEIGKRLGFQEAQFPLRIHFVPGNHDVCRDFVADAHVEKANLRRIKDRKDIGDLLLKPENQGLRDLILSRLTNYSDFYRKFKNNPNAALLEILWYRTGFQDNKQSPPVSIIGLCSSWLSQSYWCAILKPNEMEDDEEPTNYLALCDVLVEQKMTQTDNDLVIALMHHNFETLAEMEKDFIRSSLQNNCDFVLCGHVHKDRLWVRPLGGRTLVIQAGSLFLDRGYRNAFNIVEVDTDARIGRMVVVEYHKDDWVIDKRAADLTLGERAAGYNFDSNSGVLIFPLEFRDYGLAGEIAGPTVVLKKTGLFKEYFSLATVENLHYLTKEFFSDLLWGSEQGSLLDRFQFDTMNGFLKSNANDEHLQYLAGVFPKYQFIANKTPIGLEAIRFQTVFHFINKSNTPLVFEIPVASGTLDKERWEQYGTALFFKISVNAKPPIHLRADEDILVSAEIVLRLEQQDKYLNRMNKIQNWIVAGHAFWELIRGDIRGLAFNLLYINGESESREFGLRVALSQEDIEKVKQVDVDKVLGHIKELKPKLDDYEKKRLEQLSKV